MYVRVEVRAQDDVLHALTSGDPHQQDDDRSDGLDTPDGTGPGGPNGGGEPAPVPSPATEPKTYTEEEALACSLEDPEACEACQ